MTSYYDQKNVEEMVDHSKAGKFLYRLQMVLDHTLAFGFVEASALLMHFKKTA